MTVSVLVEFTGCTFDEPIDLYAANLTGWRLTRCALPGLQAANVRVHSELMLENCTVTGLVVLSEAQVEGNIDLRGTRLACPGGDAVEASGVRVGGNLCCERGFSAQGRVVLAGASVTGNAMFSGAALQGSTDPDEPAVLVLLRGSADATAALVADRLAVHGDLEARRSRRGTGEDFGALQARGQLRLVGARVHGSVGLTGARLHAPGLDVLFADRLGVGGSLFLRGMVAAGSIRLHHAHAVHRSGRGHANPHPPLNAPLGHNCNDLGSQNSRRP